jgi:glycosyltransferase involved in cell wall biosynthesis
MNRDTRPGILFLEALPTIAGGQTVLLNLIPALVDRFRLAALLPGAGPLADALNVQGVQCFFAPVGRYSLMRKSLRDVAVYSARTPLLVWRTHQLIRHWGANLLYANSGPTFLWGTLAAQITGRPILWHHHNLLADGKTLQLVHLTARLPAVRKILCASLGAQAQLAGAQLAAVAAKTVVVPNGVDTGRFFPDAVARARIRNELGIDDAAPVIGMVGDLIPLKHQDTLLAALPQVLADAPNAWILLVGDVRPRETESARYAARLRQSRFDRVRFLGRRADLPAVLNALDLLVVASERETGPLVLLEALASGVPVISTPVGNAPDLLESAALFPIGDADALAHRLQLALASPTRRAEASAAARRTAEERLSLETFRQKVTAVIDQVCETQAE